MTHNEAFHLAILEEPEQDAPRLIYADWLEEHGQADRADFIRTQCRLATLAPGDEPWADLELHCRDLLARHWRDWLPPEVPRCAVGWTFRRGFVEAIDIEPNHFVVQAGELLRAAPIQHVRFILPPGRNQPISAFADLLACPEIGRLRGLDLAAFQLTDEQVCQLAAIPALANLGFLKLNSSGLNARALRALTGSPLRQALRHLELGEQTMAPRLDGNRALRLLAGSPHLAGLTGFKMPATNATDEALEALAGSPHLTHLADLDLSHSWRLSSDGVQALANSENFARLGRLDLSGMRLGYTGVHDLTASPHLANLHALYLHDTDLNQADLRILRAAPRLAELTALGLGSNPLTAWDLAELLRALQGGRLADLALPRVALGRSAWQALADWPGLARLTHLDLSETGLDLAGLQVLLASPHWQRLTTLRLARNSLGDDGARLLAESPALTRLAALDLTDCDLGADGLAALASSPHLRRLEELRLGSHAWGEEITDVLLSADWPRLWTLDLGRRGLPPDVIRRLMEAPGLPCLTRLEVAFPHQELIWSLLRARHGG
jgi:uncharacterized protein (TIGR02996 family)